MDKLVPLISYFLHSHVEYEVIILIFFWDYYKFFIKK